MSRQWFYCARECFPPLVKTRFVIKMDRLFRLEKM